MFKVIGVGFHRTGTKTLGAALRTFGYRHASYDLEALRYLAEQGAHKALALAAHFDSFADWPWALLYREFDERFPGSRFILTTRVNAEVWLGSLSRHAAQTGPTFARQLIYGRSMPSDDPAHHIAVYEAHNKTVRAYFAHRSESFLEVCWERGDGWNELCRFLGRRSPETSFPHEY